MSVCARVAALVAPVGAFAGRPVVAVNWLVALVSRAAQLAVVVAQFAAAARQLRVGRLGSLERWVAVG